MGTCRVQYWATCSKSN